MTTFGGGWRDWQRWAPRAAVAWSLTYAALGICWLAGGRGFPFNAQPVSGGSVSVMSQLGPVAAWGVVIAAGLPAAALGTAMLRSVRRFRLGLLAAGALLAAVLLLLMTDLTLLVNLAYVPYAVVALITGAEFGRAYLAALTEWTVLHQLLCLCGGFLWLAATVSYARQISGACLYCGRRDGPAGWTSPGRAARWGRLAVGVALVVPVVYAATRCAWALGIPLGMSAEALRQGQASGTWISGLFLAAFGLVGAVLTLGLAQRWGEVFPRWMIGLAGRRVPIALAVVPAAIVSVLLVVGGVSIWAGYAQLADGAAATGQSLLIVVGPTLLFPVWGVALAAAATGYYYRRRGPCRVCGRGAPDLAPAPETS